MRESFEFIIIPVILKRGGGLRRRLLQVQAGRRVVGGFGFGIRRGRSMVGFSGVRWGREGGGRRRGAKRKVGSEGELLLVILISVEAFEVGLRGGGGGRSGGSGGDREVVKEEREEREKGDEAKMSVAASWDEKGEWGRNHHQRGGLSPELRHHHLL